MARTKMWKNAKQNTNDTNNPEKAELNYVKNSCSRGYISHWGQNKFLLQLKQKLSHKTLQEILKE